jgi:hypothetical protein
MCFSCPWDLPADAAALMELLEAETQKLAEYSERIKFAAPRKTFSIHAPSGEVSMRTHVSVQLHSVIQYEVPVVSYQVTLDGCHFAVGFPTALDLFALPITCCPVSVSLPDCDMQLKELHPWGTNFGFLVLTSAGELYCFFLSERKWSKAELSDEFSILALSASASILVLQITPSSFLLVDSVTFRILHRPAFTGLEVCHFVISAGSKVAAFAATNGQVLVLYIRSSQCHSLPTTCPVYGIAIAPSGDFLVLQSDRDVIIRHLGHPMEISQSFVVANRADLSDHLALIPTVLGGKPTLLLHSLQDGYAIARVLIHGIGIQSVRMVQGSPHRTSALVEGDDGTFSLWTIAFGHKAPRPVRGRRPRKQSPTSVRQRLPRSPPEIATAIRAQVRRLPGRRRFTYRGAVAMADIPPVPVAANSEDGAPAGSND